MTFCFTLVVVVQVKFDLDDLCTTYLKDLDLKAELEKAAGATEESQVKIKKTKRYGASQTFTSVNFLQHI